MRDSQEEIIGLLDQSTFNEQGENTPSNRTSSHPKRSNLIFLVLAVLSVLIAIDITAYAYITGLLFSQVGLDDLEFRSSYVGLDELYKTGQLKPIRYNRTINMPRSAVQVYATDPDKVSPQGDHQWLSDFGTLAPPDRHLQVNNTVRTLLHFRVLDFGMEKCSFALRLPGPNDTLPHPFSLGDGTTPNISLKVCQLDTARTNLECVSWNNRPRCLKDVAVLGGGRGIEAESEPFACASGSQIAFEISCAAENPACQLDVWSNQNATWGIFMYQRQTM